MRTIHRKKSSQPRGFTLIELSIVILIISLILALVLKASFAATESARVRATQSLITKLSVGLEERIEALLTTQPEVNGAHRFLASINTPAYPIGSSNLPWGLQSDQRAQVLARIDQIRAEFPDVFYIDPPVANGGSKGVYPIRFAGLPYPDPSATPADFAPLVLPIGNTVAPGYFPDTAYVPGAGGATNLGPGAAVGGTGTGINGASYAAAASLYKLIGYTPRGYDGLDNGNDNSSPLPYIDDYNEGISNPDGTPNAEAVDKVDIFLKNHTHKTARSEMLYALLVEGLGPLGAVFNKEEFRDNEIQDTDGDGVPEFVDAWGEPLQFYFRPFAYRSDYQKGDALYGAFETRQQNTLDPNGQLTALSWWCDNNSASTMSAKCVVAQNLFGPLYDPNWVSGVSPQPTAWDRSGQSGRRAYRTKFLIISGGADRVVGIPRIADFEVKNPSNTTLSLARAMSGTVAQSASGVTVTPGEGWGMALDPSNLPPWATSNPDYLGLQLGQELDDIGNQDIQKKSGGFQ